METHPNGGGKRGYLVSCSSSAYLDRLTDIHDQCAIWGSPRLRHCSAFGNCRISGNASAADTVADGFVTLQDNVQVQNSRLETTIGSEINLYDEAILRGCTIKTPAGARVEIGGYATLDGVTIVSGGVHIEGGAIIRDCELEADTWLHRGVWLRPPLQQRTDRWTISECVPGYIHVQCQCHAIDQWQQMGIRLAQLFGLDEHEIEDCRQAVLLLMARLERLGKVV